MHWGNQFSTEDPMHRFMDKIDIGDNLCWLYPHQDKNGYAALYFGTKAEKGHRFMYQVYKGDIPNGMEIDHLCMVKNCINPEHLELVSHTENMARLFESMKTCRKGHEYIDGNFRWIKQDDRNVRLCLKCQRLRDIKKIDRRRNEREQIRKIVRASR